MAASNILGQFKKMYELVIISNKKKIFLKAQILIYKYKFNNNVYYNVSSTLAARHR